MTDAILSAKVTADIADFNKKFGEMQGSLDGLSRQVSSPASAASSAADSIEQSTGRWKGAFLAVGAVLAAGALHAASTIGEWTRAAAQAAERTEQISQQTGIAAQTLESWSVALNRVGLDTGSFSRLFKALSKDIVAARSAADFSTTKFAELGLTISQLGDTEHVIRAIADRLSQMTDPAQRAQMAVDLLGREGLKLIPILMQGSAVLDQTANQARQFGLVLSDSARSQLVQYDDALDDLGLAWEGLKTQVAVAAVPILLKGVELAQASIAMAGQIIDWMQRMVAGVRLAFAQLGAIFDGVRAKTDAVKNYFKGLYDAVVGHSYIPDMVDEIGRHMQQLDVAMTGPARNAVVNTGRVIEGAALTWQGTINQFVSTLNFGWGSVTQTVGASLAQMTTQTVNWAAVGLQIGQQFLSNMINLALQLLTQWVLTAAGMTSAHTAMEAAKTTITATNEAARLGITLATNKAIMAGTIASLASIAAVGNASMAVMQAVVLAQAAVLAAMGAALTASVVGAPFAPGFFAAAATVAASGTAAVLASMAAIQAALGTAIVATTAALATPFAKGGAVFGPTLALVGENATRRNPEFIGHANQLGLNGGGGPQTIIIELDGRPILKYVGKNLGPQARLQGGFS